MSNPVPSRGHHGKRPVSRRRARQRGHVVMEAALVFLVFFSMLVGIFDFAQFLYVHSALAERVRSAVRYGASLPSPDLQAVRNLVLYNSTVVPVATDANQPPPASFNLDPSNVEVTLIGQGTDDARLQVRVVNFQFIMLSPMAYGYKRGAPITATLPLSINY